MSEDENSKVIVMASATFISVSEYLATSYRPDRDYVDGEVRERNLGEWGHSRLQYRLALYLSRYEEPFGLMGATEQRVQVKATRFRVPDMSMVLGDPGEEILTRPPFLCIEILSPEDSLPSIRDRIEDYLAFGVENVGIADPEKKKAYWADAAGIHEAPDAVLETRNLPVRVDFKELWPPLQQSRSTNI